MNWLKLAVVVVPFLFAVVGACTGSTREFGDATAGSRASGGNGDGESTRGGSSAQAGSTPAQSGGSDNASGASNSGQAGEGGTGAPECLAGQQVGCWELEDGTPIDGPVLTDGSCHEGQRFCDEDGFWGPCLGAVGPKSADACDVAGNDDDCDGQPNGAASA